MRFGTWNVRSLCRVGAIKSVVRESGKYKLDLREIGIDGANLIRLARGFCEHGDESSIKKEGHF
jgi:hypothetical protein